MQIVVKDIPSACSECLYLGVNTIIAYNTSVAMQIKYNVSNEKYFTGCTLLKVEIPNSLSSDVKLNDCLLIEYNKAAI